MEVGNGGSSSVSVGVFDVHGTDAERELVRQAMARTRVDWQAVFAAGLRATGRHAVEVWWVDLSSLEPELDADDNLHFELEVDHPHFGHALVDRRQTASPRVLGVAWSNARIDVDRSLGPDPDLATLVLVAELAHELDFLCFSPRDRAAVYGCLHGDLSADVLQAHGLQHGWWGEQAGHRYRAYLRSALMDAVVKAVSDIPTGEPPLFPHQAPGSAVEAVRRMLGRPEDRPRTSCHGGEPTVRCQSRVEANLGSYVLGALRHHELREVDDHLAVCDRCLDDAKRLDDVVLRLVGRRVNSPPAVWAQTVQHIRRSRAEARGAEDGT